MKQPKLTKKALRKAVRYGAISARKASLIWKMLINENMNDFDKLGREERILLTIIFVHEIENTVRLFAKRLPRYEADGRFVICRKIKGEEQLVTWCDHHEYVDWLIKGGK